MRIHEPPSWFSPVSLLTILFLLSAVPAFADPPSSMHGAPHGDSKKAHSSSATHGTSGSVHRDGHHPKASYQGHGDYSRSSHHDGMQKRHGGEGYGGHDSGSTHSRRHQDAREYIGHILKFKEGMSLTEDQAQQLHDLKTNYKKTRIKMKAAVKLASIDLHEVLRNEKASLSDIEAQLNAMHALKTKLYMASIKAKRDAKTVLSEEQQARMDKIHERIKSHGGNMAHSGAGDYSKYKKNKGH